MFDNHKIVYVEELNKDIEAPSGWEYTAVRIFADKYLCDDDCNSIPNALWRVASGVSDGDNELANYLYTGMYEQRFAFNSPVFFNVGVEDEPQCSACFIQSVQDNMDSILELAVKEGKLFQYGSGTGTNLSELRGCQELISGGGTASGPVSFMKVYDAVAGIVKSGGKTRRAAKMQILDVDHPDIIDFIECKAREEAKARDLITKAGYDSSFNGEAYSSIFFQNANLSVRVTDAFMEAQRNDLNWDLTARTTGLPIDSLPAGEIWDRIAQAAWECGDPGIQFHDTINRWHTCKLDGEIVASNPCSEYLFLEETACNLASLNLAVYLGEDGSFNIDRFVEDVHYLVVAMDNIVSLAGYPTEDIELRSLEYRTLGLGYTNLGYALMRLGLRYDTKEARDWAASVTALMHFAACRTSAQLAQEVCPYPAYEHNALLHLSVLAQHDGYLQFLPYSDIADAARQCSEQTMLLVAEHGMRNAQVTVLAPTGTISFIMGAVTTGIEPAFARTITKRLVGGGQVVSSLEDLPIDTGSIVTADEIEPVDHLLMMAACQPFLSGGISKTVNMPATATVDDIKRVYEDAYSLGLKSVAVYRDGCKLSQPLNSSSVLVPPAPTVMQRAVRHPLPDLRPAITHKFSVGGHDGYVTVGLYADGRPGEVFVKIAKEGSTISGLLDAFAIGLSMGLQYGIPLSTLLDKHLYARFEPSGVTTNPQIPMAHSIVDYIARWMLLHFDTHFQMSNAIADPVAELKNPTFFLLHNKEQSVIGGDTRICPDCGSILVRTGSCYGCASCGYSAGCS